MFTRIVIFTGARDIDAGVKYLQAMVAPLHRKQRVFRDITASGNRSGGVLGVLYRLHRSVAGTGRFPGTLRSWSAAAAGLALTATSLAATSSAYAQTRAGAGVSAAGAEATAVSYARQQLGKPYQWGGTGPDAFDCSGLVMEAYASAGISIPRTADEQWAAGPQVPASQVDRGDLVFFAGAYGTAASPGHVGIVIGNGEMIEAYATGYAIRVSTYGTASSPPGDQNPVGFTDPAAQG